jgi:subfamily B ATP-binding cassette protein HlyB/CyaB
MTNAAEAPKLDPAFPDAGLLALGLVSSFLRTPFAPDAARHDLALGDRAATGPDLVRAAKRLGLKARLLDTSDVGRLSHLPLPVILELEAGCFVVLGRCGEEGRCRIIDPAKRSVEHLSVEALGARWSGRGVLVARRSGFTTGFRDAGLGWFLPVVWRYRRALGAVVAASLFIQLCALVTPLLFQLTIDKVLASRNAATLAVVVLALCLLGLFHVILQHLRHYVLTHTTSRIDVELGARIFEHLMRLPLGYFETRPAGQTVACVRELETVRGFLTGQALTSAIDIPFTLVFLAILYLYAPFLALVVTLSLPAYLLVTAALRPTLRARALERLQRSASSSQFLVEAMVGIHTIKASALEPVFRRQWEERLAAYVRSSFTAGLVASLGQNAIQYLSKVTTALVLLFGAHAVMNGELTIGGLVAFNMITGQITGPILRLSQLWQDFQQVRLSIDRLGDVLGTPPEAGQLAQGPLPPAAGAISIRGVSFRYAPGAPKVLSDVTLDIPAGQVIGIVGPSGSGKSTLTKLLQRLYGAERGRVLLDEADLAHVDPAWLRRQVGVVLQDNLLFSRTIFENIAIADPSMPRSRILHVAKLAGADEFIDRLPLGYDTPIEERGTNLSGGQRQRLAIARALASDPRVLIFDEATSALDVESERIIHENMRQIARGRTVIIIAHRLAAVRACDRIVALKDGRLVEDGTHEQLLARPDSLYRHLWRMQSDDGRPLPAPAAGAIHGVAA